MPLGDDSPDSLYLTKTANRDQSATIQNMLDDMAARGTPPPPAPPPAQPGDPGQPTVPDAPPGTWSSSLRPDPTQQAWSRGMKALGNEALSIGHGAVEAYPQWLAGPFEAVRAGAGLVGEAGGALQQNLPSWAVASPEDAAKQEADRQALMKEIGGGTAREFSLHDITGIGGPPQTVIGEFSRAASQFLTGYGPALKAAGLFTSSGSVASMAASGLSMFLGQDPTQANFANLIAEKYPSAKGAITDLLASNPDDPAIVNRLRNSFEGVVSDPIGRMLVAGVVLSAKMARAALVAKAAATDQGGAVIGAAPDIGLEKVPGGEAVKGAEAVARGAETPEAAAAAAAPPGVIPTAADVATARDAQSFIKNAQGGDAGAAAANEPPTSVGVAPGQGAPRVPAEPLTDDEIAAAKPLPADEAAAAEPAPAAAPGPADEVPGTGAAPAEPAPVSPPPDVEATAPAPPPPPDAAAEAAAAVKPPLPTGQAATDEVGVPGQVTGKAVTESVKAQTLADLNVKVNWDNIDKGDLKGTIGDIASQMKDRISAAKRDVISLEAQKQLANDLSMTPEELRQRPIGQTYNAEQIIAAGKLMQASDERLLQLADKAQLSDATDADAYRVNEQLVTHMAMIENFLGVSGEAGRALGALRAVHQLGTVSRYQAMQNFLNQSGGKVGAQRLSQMITDLAAKGTPPGGVNVALQRTWGRFAWDAVKEGWALGFLWKPVTQMRNIIGNVAEAVWQSSDRRMAERYSAILGDPLNNAVVPGEAMAYQRGQIAAIKDAFVVAGRAFRSGTRQFNPINPGAPVVDPNAGGLLGANTMTTDAATKGALQPSPYSSAGWAQMMGKNAVQQQAFTATPLGKAIDYIGNTVSLPGRFLTSADDWFKMIAYGGEKEAQAYRQAMGEGLQGEQFGQRVADLSVNPPENINIASIDHANYATFNEAPGKWGSGMLAFRNSVQPVFLAMPYVRTPSNLFRSAMERSPVAFMVKQWRDDFAAGGPRQSLALAKMTTGSMATALLYDFAHNGHLTGPLPGDPAQNQAMQGAGIRPMSIRVGGVDVGISGLGQLAPMLAIAAATNELMTKKDLNPEAYDSIDEWTGALASVIAYSTANQSSLTGLNQLFGLLDASKSAGGDKQWGQYFRDRLSDLGNQVPGVPFVRAVGSGIDPVQREVNSWSDALLWKDIPGLSDRLIPIRDVFGHEIKVQPEGKLGLLYNFISPFRLSFENDHPAFNEMVRLHTGLARIGWKAQFAGVDVNFRDYPEVLDQYRRLAGNELKYNPETGEKIGFEDFINRVVSGKDPFYSQIYATRSDVGDTGTDSGKAQFIKEWATKYRQLAQRQIMSEAQWRYPEFYDAVKQGQAHKATQKLPTYLQGQGMEGAQAQMNLIKERPVQAPLPDRFGAPAIGSQPQQRPGGGGGGFTVP